MLFVWLFKLTAYIPLMLAFRVRVRGRGRLPKGPCILALNHGAAMDPVMVNLAFPFRRIYMLTSKKLFDFSRLHRWELRQMGCRPSLSPSGDMETMAQIAGRLRGYEHIAYFAEGRIQAGIGSFRGGAVLLALQTGLPLVPAYIRTASARRGGTCITFGDAIPAGGGDAATTADGIARLNEELRKRVIMLSDDE